MLKFVKYLYVAKKQLYICPTKQNKKFRTMQIQNAERTKRAIIHPKSVEGYMVTILHYNSLVNDWLVVFSNKQPALYSKEEAIEWAESMVG
jgi:hypothetical protein